MSKARLATTFVCLALSCTGALSAEGVWSTFSRNAVEARERIDHPPEIVLEITVPRLIRYGTLRILYTRLGGNRLRSDRHRFVTRVEHHHVDGGVDFFEQVGRTNRGQWDGRFLIDGTRLEDRRRYSAGDRLKITLIFDRMPVLKKGQVVDTWVSLLGFEEDWDFSPLEPLAEHFIDVSSGVEFRHLSADIELNAFPSQRGFENYPKKLFTTILVDDDVPNAEACIFYQRGGRPGDLIRRIRTAFEILRTDGSRTVLRTTLGFSPLTGNCACADKRIDLAEGDVVMSTYRFVHRKVRTNNFRIGTFLSARAVCNSRGY